jgi:hypothetical protein
MVIGWDIGGVNTKVARVDSGKIRLVSGRPYELQRAPAQLIEVLKALACEVGAVPGSDFRCGVTMTAELSQMFRTKREGVAFVLDAMESAFPRSPVHVFRVDGRFVTPPDARRSPLEVAAANWAATASVVATRHRDALLVDIGTTTTDLIPVIDGRVGAEGRTDPERLTSGELVYTGAVRTPAEAMTSVVPLQGGIAGVSAEGFALAGDVHLWRGDLDPGDYTWPTPDGRPATRAFAAERLARVVCADLETIDEAGITAIADALAAAQAERIAGAMRRVIARHPSIRAAVVTGLGAFLGARAARAVGMDVIPLSAELGDPAARYAPAACVALLLDRTLHEEAINHEEHEAPEHHPLHRPNALVNIVVKLGGGLLAAPGHVERALEAIAAWARQRPLLVIPGGGPFADAVRDVDRRLALSDDAAHWAAILAMDQYAQVIASRLAGGEVVETRHGIHRALAAGRVPVLAPARWLREADPLPHSWSVTSDSIAAWVAGQVGAGEILLIKPANARGASMVDGYFQCALPEGVQSSIVTADRLDAWLHTG